MFHIYLICLTFTVFEGSLGQIVVTQTPSLFQANPGDTVTIRCQTSSSVSNYMNLYQFKAGETPKLLIYYASTRFEGTPDRFSGSGSSTDFSFTIKGVRPEDEGEYYCGQSYSRPYTFGQGTKLEIKRNDATPSASIFPPSEEQLKTSSATVVCLIDGFYPGDLGVVWKMDGTAATTKQVQTSSVARNTDQTYRLSSTLALSTEEYNSHEEYTCEVTHKTLSQPLVKSFTRTGCSG
ncbi:T-cell surface glycoprotein CD8 beta chain isoform X11 [Pogona vitticeps]